MSEERTLYEGIYILDVNLPEDQAAELVATLERAVTDAGGEVVGTRDFATRRLAYEIDGHTTGAYKLLYFHGEEPAVEAFKHETAVRQGVIRARCFVANPEAIVRGEVGGDAEEPQDEDEAGIAPVEDAPVEETAAEDAPVPHVVQEVRLVAPVQVLVRVCRLRGLAGERGLEAPVPVLGREIQHQPVQLAPNRLLHLHRHPRDGAGFPRSPARAARPADRGGAQQ